MQFFFLGRPTADTLANPPANLMEAARGDWAAARDYYGQGIFRQMWGMGIGVIAICEAETREQMEGLIRELPMWKAGLIEYDLQELSPYRGFAPEPKSA